MRLSGPPGGDEWGVFRCRARLAVSVSRFIQDALSGFRVRPHKASSGIDKVGGKARVEAPDYRNRIGDLVLPRQARARLETAEILWRDFMSEAGSPIAEAEMGAVKSQAAIRWNDPRRP
jgi:hypothetical protein